MTAEPPAALEGANDRAGDGFGANTTKSTRPESTRNSQGARVLKVGSAIVH
jgi:hypothetical protein